MGFLNWRGWDRLDDLDRRTGFRRAWTEEGVRRTERFLWLISVLVAVAAVLSLLQGDWAWGVLNGTLAIAAPFWNRRVIRRIRDRAGLG